MSANNNVEEKIINIMAKAFLKDPTTFKPETSLAKDLGAKSVTIMQVMTAIEDEFDITCNFMNFRRQDTVGKIVEYIIEICED